MTLSEEWIETSLTVIKILAFFIITLILSAVTAIIEKRATKKSQA